MNSTVYTLTEAQLKEVVRKAMQGGWDAAVNSMTYPDGTRVEVAENDNPYR